MDTLMNHEHRKIYSIKNLKKKVLVIFTKITFLLIFFVIFYDTELATDLPSPKFKLGRRGSTFSSMRLSQKASSNHQVRRNTTRVRTRSYKDKKVMNNEKKLLNLRILKSFGVEEKLSMFH